MSIAEQILAIKEGKFVVYVGRFNPVHLGHQAIINAIIESSPRHLILVGSCNNPVSYRHLFSFESRLNYLRTLCPQGSFAPLPDFPDNESWFAAMDSLIELAGGNPKHALYIGGSKEDIEFYGLFERETFIINRYTGHTLPISASEVRDALIENRLEDLSKLVDGKICKTLIEDFKKSWAELRKK